MVVFPPERRCCCGESRAASGIDQMTRRRLDPAPTAAAQFRIGREKGRLRRKPMAERKSEELLALFDTARLDRRYWTTFGLLASGTVLDYFDFFIVGYLIAQLGPAWHLTYGQSSTILLAAGIGAIAGALVWGPLSHQLGRKRQLVFGYLICAVGAGGISLIPDGDWVMFAALRFIVGF